MLTILDEAVEALQALKLVPTRNLLLAPVRAALDPSVAEPLATHAFIEQQLDHASQQNQDLQLLEDELRHSTRSLYRSIRALPGVVQDLKSVLENDGLTDESDLATPAMHAFIDTFIKLRDQVSDRLSVSVEGEKAQEDRLADIQAKGTKTAQALRELQRNLIEERTSRDRELKRRDDMIAKLGAEISSIRNSTLASVESIEMEGNSQRDQKSEFHKSVQSKLTEEVERLNSELEQKKAANKESEEQLGKKKKKVEEYLAEWISKYDHEMGEKTKELEALQAMYDEERKEVDRLEQYFERLMMEREHQLAEERKKAEVLARRMAQRQALDSAARLLQRKWRRVLARRGKKLKAGGGGKKEKKKKK